MAEDVYPTEGKFQLRVKTVDAIFFDGSMASAHEVLAWIFRRNGDGVLSKNMDSYSENSFWLNITDINGSIPEGAWIVQLRRLEFVCLNDVQFREMYEPIREKIEVQQSLRRGEYRVPADNPL